MKVKDVIQNDIRRKNIEIYNRQEEETDIHLKEVYFDLWNINFTESELEEGVYDKMELIPGFTPI